MKRMMMTACCFSLVLCLFVFSGCAKKDTEKIIITIQTDPVVERTTESEERVKTPKPVKAPPVEVTRKEPEPPVSSSKFQLRQDRSTASQEVTSLAPMAPAPSPLKVLPHRRPVTDEDQIMAIIRRQEVAFEDKDVALYMADLIDASAKLKREVVRFFERYEAIDISFEPQDITVKGNKARVILLQNTHLVPKRGSQPQEQRAKILWGLKKVDGDWKIEETKILKKY